MHHALRATNVRKRQPNRFATEKFNMQFDTNKLNQEQISKLLTPGNGTIAATIALSLAALCWSFLSLLFLVTICAVVVLYVTRSRKLMEALQAKSGIDPETLLLSGDKGLRVLEAETDRAVDTGQPIGAVVVSLKKSDGSSLGSADASDRDRVIKTSAHEIERVMSAYDVAARVGDTIFLLILPGADDDRLLAVSTELEKGLKFGTMSGVRIKSRIEMENLGDDKAKFLDRIKSLM
jgi:GGDEF domain-containing protein